MIHETRVIPLDRRPHVAAGVRQYLGDARAHFDGETLVVETTGFRAESAPQRASAAVKMTERFKRAGGHGRVERHIRRREHVDSAVDSRCR